MTLIIDIKQLKSEDEIRKALEPAISSLRQKGIVIYPTDTVYGIGCDPRDKEALRRLLSLKGRSGKPLPLLASDINSVKSIAELPRGVEGIIEAFWPGPLTLVLPLKASLPYEITLGSPRVGIRIPNHPVARMLAKEIGGLIVGTSANKSGEQAPRTFEEAYSWFREEVDVAINGGPCIIGQPSTVIEVSEGKIKVLREGAVKINEVLKAMRR